jgi:hypothetical protein
VCQDAKIMLPLKFGVTNSFFSNPVIFDKIQVVEAIEAPEIIHYAGNAPWVYHKNYHAHKEIWWKNKGEAKLGFNNINFGYLKSMILHYARSIRFVIIHFKPFPRMKPSTISKKEVLRKIYSKN